MTDELQQKTGFPRYGRSGCVLLHDEVDEAIDNIVMDANSSGVYSAGMLKSIRGEITRLLSESREAMEGLRDDVNEMSVRSDEERGLLLIERDQLRASNAAKDAQIEQLRDELSRLKGNPSTRLHNVCEALEADLKSSPYSKQEWERLDRENVRLAEQNKALRNFVLHTEACGLRCLGKGGTTHCTCGLDAVVNGSAS